MSFRHRVQVPFFQVDMQGVVFNMWYLAWFDEAMTAYFAAQGLPWQEMAAGGYDVQLVHVDIDWTGAVRFGDEVEVEVSAERVGTTSFALRFRVLVGDAVPVSANIVYVVVGIDGSGKRPVPEPMRAVLAV